MDEGRALEIALFRYNCIAELVRGPLPRGEQNRILQRLAHREWEAPGGVKVRVSVSALKAWLARYRQGGFEALKPRTRSDQGRPRAVDGTLLDRLAQLKAELPQRSVPQLIRLLEKDPSSGIAPGSLKRATIYRHLAARGLTARTRKIRRAYHPFQRQAPGELWQLDETDGLLLPDPHRPGKWRKTVLFVVVDDHSRFSPHCQFYPDQKMPRLEHCLRQALGKAGIPQALYLDRARIHVSNHFRAACATLGIQVILGRRRQPAGRGKVERLIETIQQQFFPEARALIATGEITTPEQLNLYLAAWLEEDYHQRPHSETGEPPRERYFRAPPPLPDPVALANLFLTRTRRLVRKTAIISLHGNRYQVDPALVGSQVELRYDPFDLSRVEVWVGGRFHQLATPHTLSTTTAPGTPQDPEPPTPRVTLSYLKLLKAQHDSRLAEEVQRLRFRDLPQAPSAHTATGGVAPLLTLLATCLGRTLTPTEITEAQAFWNTWGPLDLQQGQTALQKACLELGPHRHLIVYLEALKNTGRRPNHV